MSFLTRLRLGHRLGLAFGLVLLLLIGTTGLSLLRMQGLTDTLDRVAVQGAERSQALMGMERAASRFTMTLRDMPGAELAQSERMMQAAQAAWAAYVEAEQAASSRLPADGSAQQLMAQAGQTSLAVHALMAKALKEAGDRGLATAFFNIRLALQADPTVWVQRQQAWADALVALSSWDDAERRAATAESTAAAASAQGLVIGGALLALGIGAFTAWRLTRDVSQGIAEAVAATARIARHDLSTAIHTRRHDELGDLARGLESMRMALHTLAAGVRGACGDIATASAEIAQGSQDLSQRTELAAITLQRAIGSIGELTGSVDQTAQSAGTANGLATQAHNVAGQGGQVVAEAVSTMDQIDAASRRIADITAIIDGIAFQTNILALNAAVEAARAGEQGRGFAVVASEVRTLAQRSATAAREIKGLIEDSLNKVAAGSGQVRRAGSATGEIVSSVRQVSDMIAAISAEAGQQRQGIGQARDAVQELDQVAQQNAALAEQSAAAAGSLQQQAQRLTSLVAQFRLETA